MEQVARNTQSIAPFRTKVIPVVYGNMNETHRQKPTAVFFQKEGAGEKVKSLSIRRAALLL